MSENGNKVKKTYVSRFSKLDNITEPFDRERCEELVDEGFSDSYIAGEMNMDEAFVKTMILDMNKDTEEE